jgi:hypothetical protein
MSPHSSKPRNPRILAASIGVLAVVVAGCADSGGDQTRAPSPLDSVVPSAPTEIPDFSGSPADVTELSAPPGDPVEAVRLNVTPEIGGDGERSFGLLSASARASAGSAADWVEGTSQRPTILAFELDPDPLAVGRRERSVTGTVTLDPRLDEVSGFVPAHAEVDWRVVAEDGGWRVDIADSTLHPVLPDEAGAPTAAATWATARQKCRIDGEYAGSLLGSPLLGEQLCGVDGDIVAASPRPLGDTLASEVVAAFGPDATSWTRTVALSGAAELTVVTAPFDDHWVVVGVTT